MYNSSTLIVQVTGPKRRKGRGPEAWQAKELKQAVLFFMDEHCKVQLNPGVFEHCVLCIQEIYGLHCPYKLQCKTQHFPKHNFPVHTTQNVQTQ